MERTTLQFDLYVAGELNYIIKKNVLWSAMFF